MMTMNVAPRTMDAGRTAAEADIDDAALRRVNDEGLITDFSCVADFTLCHVSGAFSCVTHAVSLATE